MLHDIKGKNRWCGPSAMAALTGIDTDSASRMIRAQTGKNSTTRVATRDLLRAFYAMRFSSKETHNYKNFATESRPTLASFLKNLGKGTFLIVVGHHFIAVHVNGSGHKVIADSHHKKAVPAQDFGWKKCGRRSRVESCYEVARAPVAAA